MKPRLIVTTPVMEQKAIEKLQKLFEEELPDYKIILITNTGYWQFFVVPETKQNKRKKIMAKGKNENVSTSKYIDIF